MQKTLTLIVGFSFLSFMIGIYFGIIYHSKVKIENDQKELSVPINQDFVCRRILQQYYMESNLNKKKDILKKYYMQP